MRLQYTSTGPPGFTCAIAVFLSHIVRHCSVPISLCDMMQSCMADCRFVVPIRVASYIVFSLTKFDMTHRSFNRCSLTYCILVRLRNVLSQMYITYCILAHTYAHILLIVLLLIHLTQHIILRAILSTGAAIHRPPHAQQQQQQLHACTWRQVEVRQVLPLVLVVVRKLRLQMLCSKQPLARLLCVLCLTTMGTRIRKRRGNRFLCAGAYIYTCTCANMYIYVYICTYVYINRCIYFYIYIYTHTYIYICICIFSYTHTHTHTHKHTHTHTHTHTPIISHFTCDASDTLWSVKDRNSE